MASKLEQLRAMTMVVADTGDCEAVRRFEPVDRTTDPTLVLKAAQSPAGAELIDEARVWGRSHHAVTRRVAHRLDRDETTFRLLLNEDAMATEKLAEGIRLFARDLGMPRELVSARLEGTVDPAAAPFAQGSQ